MSTATPDLDAPEAEADEASVPPPPAPAACTRGEQRQGAEVAVDWRIVDVPDAQLPYVFLEACKTGDGGAVRALLSLTGDRAVDIHTGDEAAFRWACEEGHLNVVRELLRLTGDRTVEVHAGAEYAFRMACVSGHLGVVRELLSLEGGRAVDVHACGESPLRGACMRGHVDVVRELLRLTGDHAADVHASNADALRWACKGGHLGVVRELLALTGDRLICPLTELPATGLRMLSDGLGDPRSPAVAAAWRAISSPGGMLRNAQAHRATRVAAGAGYRVYNWGRRGGMVVWRAVAGCASQAGFGGR